MLIGSLLFAATAIVLEVLAGEGAGSSILGASWHVPLTWPQPVRVAWWLAVAGSAAAFRVSLRRLGLPARRIADVVTVAPFLLFAGGIASVPTGPPGTRATTPGIDSRQNPSMDGPEGNQGNEQHAHSGHERASLPVTPDHPQGCHQDADAGHGLHRHAGVGAGEQEATDEIDH